MPLLRPVRIGGTGTPGNLFLAPVAGYTDRAFRSVCVDLGADLCFTELVSSEALVRDSRRTLPLLARAPNEERYAIQLFGSDRDVMVKAIAALEPFGPEFIDINCGCPVPKVIKTGAGSALLKDPLSLGHLVESVAAAAARLPGSPPVTVKIRSGWDEGSINYRETAAAAVSAGAALVSLHARTRAQGYSGKAQWSHIGDLASVLDVPVCGSGDLYSAADAERMLRETGCAAVMFARGAMGNPFIFEETRALLSGGSVPVSTPERKMSLALRQLGLLAADIGEDAACREMRKQFCSYSKGLPGGAALRAEFVRCSTLEEYRTAVAAAGFTA